MYINIAILDDDQQDMDGGIGDRTGGFQSHVTLGCCFTHHRKSSSFLILGSRLYTISEISATTTNTRIPMTEAR